MPSAKWKGKARQLARDEEDSQGNPDGAILPLGVVQSSDYDVAYTIPILVGTSAQNISLQVDTGSSDLWIASTLCSTSACTKSGSRLYNPSTATYTGDTFSIQYLQGSVSGPIYWDQVSLGGYAISNQALAAADNVQSEPLTKDFLGVLGLALPLNSVIASVIMPVIGNTADGAAFASNLFSITPASAAPPYRFLSLSLSRPGSNAIVAQLGIGRHPPEIVADPSTIHYATPVSERDGVLFWKANVRAITVYVNGVPKPVDIGQSASGGMYPAATLDTGVPLILTTSTVANGIYGAIGINPGSDGQYYVPCTQPLNMTITLDNRPEIPLHPLDLTSEPPAQSSSAYCTGLIQAADQYLSDPDSGIGDMILGVPFLRNVYMVMAYDPPDTHGIFPPANRSTPSPNINPRLGLLNLTNPTVALAEFQRVRVDNQPLNSSNTTTSPLTPPVSGRKLSVGIDVLIGLVSFFVLCFVLFAGRWFFWKWAAGRRRRRRHLEEEEEEKEKQRGVFGPYQLAGRTERAGEEGENDDEDDAVVVVPAHLRYDPDKTTTTTTAKDGNKDRIVSEYTTATTITSTTTDSSAMTRVDSDMDPDMDEHMLGGHPPAPVQEEQTAAAAVDSSDAVEDTFVVGHGSYAPGLAPDSADGQVSTRTAPSWGASRPQQQQQQQRTPSISWPLLIHNRYLSHGSSDAEEEDEDDMHVAEFGQGGGRVVSMAGVGTAAARSSRVDADVVRRAGSIGSQVDGMLFPAVPSTQESIPPRRILLPAGPRPLHAEDRSFDS